MVLQNIQLQNMKLQNNELQDIELQSVELQNIEILGKNTEYRKILSFMHEKYIFLKIINIFLERKKT